MIPLKLKEMTGKLPTSVFELMDGKSGLEEKINEQIEIVHSFSYLSKKEVKKFFFFNFNEFLIF